MSHLHLCEYQGPFVLHSHQDFPKSCRECGVWQLKWSNTDGVSSQTLHLAGLRSSPIPTPAAFPHPAPRVTLQRWSLLPAGMSPSLAGASCGFVKRNTWKQSNTKIDLECFGRELGLWGEHLAQCGQSPALGNVGKAV